MELLKKKQIYLSINDRSIRYLVCPKMKTGETLDFGEVFLEANVIEDGRIINETQLKRQLRLLVDQKKWKRAEVSFLVPDNFVTMRTEAIPNQLSSDEVKKYIRVELEGSIRLPFKDPILDFDVLSYGDETNEILLFAYPKERLKPFEKLFDEVGLDPVVADISFLSAYRTYRSLENDMNNQHLLLVQWNKFDLTLTVFHDNQPKFNRHVHSSNAYQGWELNDSGNQLVSTLSIEDLTDERDNIVITIERFMDFYQYSVLDGSEAITHVVFLGDHQDLSKLKESVSERFDIGVKSISLPNDLPNGYGALMGLSLKEAAAKQKVAIKPKVKKKAKESKRQLFKKKQKDNDEVTEETNVDHQNIATQVDE